MVDLEQEMEGIKEASQRLRTLEFSFLGVCLYIGLAAASTTDSDLLLGKQLTLPLIQGSLSILWFFFLAPLLVLAIHSYLLTNHLFLSRRIKLLREHVLHGSEFPLEKQAFRGAIEGKGVVHVLPAPLVGLLLPFSHVSTRNRRFVLYLLFAGLNVFVPLLVLLVLELEFIPFRSRIITVWQVAVIAFDVVLVLFTARSLGRDMAVWQGRRPLRLLLFSLAGFFLLASSVLLATLWVSVRGQGETSWWVKKARNFACLDLADAVLVSNAARPGEANRFGRKDDALLQVAIGADLRRRNLECANLRRVVLVKADLRHAKLRYADLERADLRRAELGSADFFRANLRHADLGGATGDQVTSFWGADMHESRLSGGIFRGTDFREADLNNAELEAADFYEAKFPGARLENSRLNGSSLEKADLSGVLANDVRARGSTFKDAVLFMGWFTRARLSATELRVWETGGLILRGADLRGAGVTTLELIDLAGANVWEAVVDDKMYAVDLRRARAVYDQGNDDCGRAEPGQKGIVFWNCQVGYIERLFRDVERRNGTQLGDEIRLLWEKRRQELARVREDASAGRRASGAAFSFLDDDEAERNLDGQLVAFDPSDELTKAWKGGASADDVYFEIGQEVLGKVCEDEVMAQALIREKAGCYGRTRDPEVWEGVQAGELAKGQECLGIGMALRAHGLSKLGDLDQATVDHRERICPVWKYRNPI